MNNKKKSCTACGIKTKGFSKIVKKADWIKVSKLTNDPPKKYIPKLNELVEIVIKMPNYPNRYIYYFAAESKSMLEKDKKNIKNITPLDSYDNYENQGVYKINSKGNAKIYIQKPVSYFVKEDGKSYQPHLHFKISNKNNTKWLKNIYTVDI